MSEPLIYDRDDVPAWVWVGGDAGWLRELIAILRKSLPPGHEMGEYIYNLERLVDVLDEIRDLVPALADAAFEATLESLIDSGQVRRLPNGKLLPTSS